MLQAWQALPKPAQDLYARLFARKDRLIAVAGLHYEEIPDTTSAAEVLHAAGFAWLTPRSAVPTRWLLALHDRTALGEACRQLKLKRSGSRKALEARLLAEPTPRVWPVLAAHGIRLRHRQLLRRLCRAHLGRSDGDLRALVVERLGLLRFAEYAPTSGSSLYPDRRTLVAHEEARRWRHSLEDPLSPEQLDHALTLLQAPAPAPYLRRFRARTEGARVVRATAEDLDRVRSPTEAAALWEALVAAGERRGCVKRWVLSLERCGQRSAALAVVKTHRETLPAADRHDLERTGRRLARKLRAPWCPSPPLAPPARTRTLRLVQQPSSGARPLWTDAGLPVEAAVAAQLRAAGRKVVRSENTLWTTLFGLLLREVVFAPVPGMLPGVCRMGPLDLGTPGFGERRELLLKQALADIADGGGPARLQASWTRDHGALVRGVSWTHWSQDTLLDVVNGIGGTGLAQVLDVLATEGWQAWRGLPDLLVLPGAKLRLGGLFPGTVPQDALLVEIKGPTDSLRDAQAIWFDRLARSSLRAELWSVVADGARR